MKQELLVLNGQHYELTAETNNQLVLLETQIKALTETRDEIRKIIQKEMEEKGERGPRAIMLHITASWEVEAGRHITGEILFWSSDFPFFW